MSAFKKRGSYRKDERDEESRDSKPSGRKDEKDGEFQFVTQLFPNRKGTAFIAFLSDKDGNPKEDALAALQNITASSMLCITEAKDGEKLNLSILVK